MREDHGSSAQEADTQSAADAAVVSGPTQTPWSIGEGVYADTIFGADGFEIAGTPNASAIHRDYFADRMGNNHWATTPGAHRDVLDGEGEANARLIAAAPDGLAFAEAYLAEAEASGGWKGDEALFVMAQAYVAKARGQ